MLGRLLDEITADPGEVLMAEGSQGLELMMLEEGSAEVLQKGERINVMEPRDFFGEISVLVDGGPRTASVVALTPLRCLVFSAHFVRTMHDRLPQVGERMEQAVRERRERDRARSSEG
jgi:CRP-like cAMP-binding protein